MGMPTIGWLRGVLAADASALSRDLPLGPISIDTRTLLAGDTFWAIRARRDGHDFVSEAFARGAKAAVVSSEWKRSAEATPYLERLIGVSDTREALRRAATEWRTAWRFPVIGVTGSNGKTSTKELIALLLAVHMRTGSTQGNLNNDIGVPLTLLAISSDSEAAVVEMGASHAGEIADLCGICRPTHGLVTSVGRAHLEGFDSLEAVARTKGELYDFVAESGTAFVPTDDELCQAESREARHRVGYGFHPRPSDWSAEFHAGTNLCFDSLAQASFEFHRTTIQLGSAGRPAALSALAALTVAFTFNIAPEECVPVIAGWQGFRSRGEVIHTSRIVILDDSYNANPTSMRAALETLSLLRAERRVAILGDMNELGMSAEHEHRELGRELKPYGVDAAILIGEMAALAAGEARAAGLDVQTYPSFDAMGPQWLDSLRAGDAVLVKGSRSARLERVVEELKRSFA